MVPEMKKITNERKQAIVYLELKNVEKYKIGKFPIFVHRRKTFLFYCIPDWNDNGVKLARQNAQNE